ncbi:MAG: TolC family protein, partial [Thermodesulfobacteriota bacterium]
LESAKAALKLQEQIVIDDVWASYYEFRTAVQSLEAAEVLLQSSLESYNASLELYQNGVGDIIELLTAQTTLADARAEQVETTTEVFTSYANLINALGTDIPTPDSLIDQNEELVEDALLDSESKGEESNNEEQ